MNAYHRNQLLTLVHQAHFTHNSRESIPEVHMAI